MLTRLASISYYDIVLISLVPAFFIMVLFTALKRSSPKTTIRLTGELVLIGIIVFCFSFLIFFLINLGFQELSELSDHVRETIPDEKVYIRFLVPGISVLSLVVIFISCAQFFKIKLTKFKRIALLILCFMPILLAVFVILIEPEFDKWLVIRLGIISTLPCFILNSTSILVGNRLLEVFVELLYNFHLLP